MRCHISLCIGILLFSCTSASAVPLTLSLNSTLSSVQFEDLFFVIGGTKFRSADIPLTPLLLEEQVAGSSLTSLSGTLEIDLDLGAETLGLLGGSILDAAVAGTNLITDDSGNQGEADLAIQTVNSLPRTYYSITNLIMDAQQASSSLVDGGGFYQIAGGQTFEIVTGQINQFAGLDLFPFGQWAQEDLSGASALNLVGGGTLVVTGGTLLELTLPFELEISVGALADGVDDAGIVLSGQIVATGIVPEPSTYILALTAIGALLMLTRRQIRRR